MIELRNISKKWGERVVLDQVSFVFPDNGFYAIDGENMSGKSTLLYLLALLDQDYLGDYFFDGEKTKELGNREREKRREEKISLLLPENNLISYLNADENLSFFDEEAALPDFLRDGQQKVSTLSGGEACLVALKEEMNAKKEILLLDEISAGLDDNHLKKALDSLLLYSKNHLVILSYHDPRLLSLSGLSYLHLSGGHLYV
jgi:putative ABC transport system permease protein